ncbi:hypothetical protein ASD68_11200 [Rhodanobacter sp. Root627]|nr:hypothetical protein ASD68_11200 [Rhodanobacter sp. Root627]
MSGQCAANPFVISTIRNKMFESFTQKMPGTVFVNTNIDGNVVRKIVIDFMLQNLHRVFLLPPVVGQVVFVFVSNQTLFIEHDPVIHKLKILQPVKHQLTKLWLQRHGMRSHPG